jgi:hypothetical protein
LQSRATIDALLPCLDQPATPHGPGLGITRLVVSPSWMGRAAGRPRCRDLRVAEVVKQDIHLDEGGAITYAPSFSSRSNTNTSTEPLAYFPVHRGSVRPALKPALPHALTALTHTPSNAREYPCDQQVTGQASFWPLQG